MQRRELIRVIGIAVAALPLAARAEQTMKMLRVGTASLVPRSGPIWQAFDQRMVELGYRDGQNYTFDYVNIPKAEEYEAGYRQLVARDVDILISSGPSISLRSALASSNTKPIVMVAIDYDPIALGFVTNLARPSGNITGLFLQQIELTVKRLQLLKNAFPDTQAVTVFFDRTSTDQWNAAQSVAGTLGLQLAGIDLGDPPFDYDKALAQAPQDYRGTVFAVASGFFFAIVNASPTSRCAIASCRCSGRANPWTPAACCLTGQALLCCTGVLQSTSFALRKERSPSTCRSSNPPNSSW